jgi:hypothetical protein
MDTIPEKTEGRQAFGAKALSDTAGTESRVVYEVLEDDDLPDASFDLILTATAFHWLDPKSRAKGLASLTKPGGCVALIWNVLQDLNLDDAFHEVPSPY